MINVCLVVWYANRSGGADVYSENLALGLAARGYRVTVLCYDASDQVDQQCRVIRFPRPDYSRWPLVWRFAPALLEFYWTRNLARISGYKPDTIIFSSPLCQRGLQRSFPKVPTIYLPHSRIAVQEATETIANPLSIMNRITKHVYYRAERAALISAATTVRFTQGLANILSEYYRLPSSIRFSVIPQAIDQPVTVLSDRNGPLRIVFVGRLVPSKNLELLIRSLDGTIGGSWHLDIVGEGVHRAELEAIVQSADLSSRVTFHGHQVNPGYYYADADLLAFPSQLENLSLVVLEAMSYGTPALVVRADHVNYYNAHHEVIRDSIDGIIANNEEDFRERLRQCLADPEQVRRMSTAAREAAAKHYWPKALDRWELLLKRIASKSNKVNCTSSQIGASERISVHP